MQAKRGVNYAESEAGDSEEDAQDVFKPLSVNVGRAAKRRKIAADSDDEYGIDAATEHALLDDGKDVSMLMWRFLCALPFNFCPPADVR